MTARRMVAVVVGGAAVAVVTALALGMSASDGWQLALLAGAPALVVGLAGRAALLSMGRRSIGAQAAVVGLTAVIAVAAGALAAALAMFLSAHDLKALVVVLVTGSTVGVVTALALGGRVAEASRALRAAADRLGDDLGDASPDTVDWPPASEELTALARQLEATAQRLTEARRHERALEASRRELVAWVSHDLRTPLAGIRAMVEALEDGVVDDPATVARYHRTLLQEADRLSLLVDDLFELSRIQAGALGLQLERASLGDLVSDALAASAPVAEAKGVRLEGHVSVMPPELRLSTPEVARALRNLLENAIRHTPSDGSVTVDVGVEDDAAVVSVADSCGGIPDDDLPRVFEPAFRGEAARTPSQDGRGGLGLAIVRGIVEAHHGDVAVRNEGGGCRFVLRLPLGSF